MAEPDKESIESRAAKKPAKKRTPRVRSAHAPKLTAAEKVERDLKLVGDKPFMSWPTLALKYGISEKQAQNIWNSYRDVAKDALIGEPALDTAFDLIFKLQAAQDKLAVIADTADNDSAKIGAIRSYSDMLMREIEVRQHMDLMPKNLGTLRHEINLRYTTQVFLSVLERHVPKAKLGSAKAELGKLLQDAATPN